MANSVWAPLQDAALWAGWGVDLLKFDGCGGPFASVLGMRNALNATGRPIVYSVHGNVAQGEMTTDQANVWRTGPVRAFYYDDCTSQGSFPLTRFRTRHAAPHAACALPALPFGARARCKSPPSHQPPTAPARPLEIPHPAFTPNSRTPHRGSTASGASLLPVPSKLPQTHVCPRSAIQCFSFLLFFLFLFILFRCSQDIGASYEQFIDRAMITNNVSMYLPGGPGGWNDPDMLQVGNVGHTANGGSPKSLYPDAEGRTQFALWCIMKSPLL